MKVKNLGKRGWYNSVKTRESIVQVNLLNLRDEKDCHVILYIKKKKNSKEFVECRQHRLANWHTYVSMRKKNMQVNLLNVDNRDWQINISMRKKILQMNLLNVDNRDCKHIKSIEKYFQ